MWNEKSKSNGLMWKWIGAEVEYHCINNIALSTEHIRMKNVRWMIMQASVECIQLNCWSIQWNKKFESFWKASLKMGWKRDFKRTNEIHETEKSAKSLNVSTFDKSTIHEHRQTFLKYRMITTTSVNEPFSIVMIIHL